MKQSDVVKDIGSNARIVAFQTLFSKFNVSKLLNELLDNKEIKSLLKKTE